MAPGVVQHADDPGGALVARRLELEAGDHLGLVGRADDRGGPGVRHLGQQRAEGEAEAGAVALGDLGELGAVGAPAQLRLGADDHEHVLVAAGDRAGVDLGGRPDDLAQTVVVESHLGSGGGEVVELLGVDVGHLVEVPAVDEVAGRGAGGVARVVPALEGGDDDGRLERGPGRPTDVDHRSTVPSGTGRSSGATTPVMLRRLDPRDRPRPLVGLVALAAPAWAHVELEPAEAIAARPRR